MITPRAGKHLATEARNRDEASSLPGAVRVDEETYRRHLDAKRYEPRAIRRRVVWEWVKRSSRWLDHLLDCEIT